ncbi:MAG: imm11 family protein [Paracoccaceae bacterium]
MQKVENDFPIGIYFSRSQSVPKATSDAFRIIDGLRVVSPALRDVLVQFAMDGVQLFEVPIYADESGTPSGLPNHCVLNVCGGKDALIPELSENIEKPIIRAAGYTEPLPNAKWTAKHSKDVVALSADALNGTDLWRDPEYQSTFFFSDRLKQAIDAAGLKTKALSFAPTRVFRRT